MIYFYTLIIIMGVVEEATENIELSMPSFSVDTLYEGVPSPLPDQAMFACFLGPPRSGKTSLSTALLTTSKPRKIYNGVFDHVYLFVPLQSFNSMNDSPFKALDPSKIIHDFTQESLATIVQKLEASTSQKENSLIVIDDFMSELKNVFLRKSLERLIANRRHLRCSVWVISQTYRAIPLTTRKMLSHVFLFRVSNLKELESIREELVPRDRNEFQTLYNHVFPPNADKHTFMYLDVSTGEIYNKFNKLLIK